MRGFAYRITQVVMDVVLALVFVRPYIDLKNNGNGIENLEIIGLFLIPVISILGMYFLRKGEVQKSTGYVIFCLILIAIQTVAYKTYIKEDVLLVIVAGTVLELFLVNSVTKKKLLACGNEPPHSVVNVLLDFILAVIAWLYMLSAETGWTTKVPAWGQATIAATIVIISIFLQFAATKEKLKLKLVWAITSVLPGIFIPELCQEENYLTNDSLLLVIVSLLGVVAVMGISLAVIYKILLKKNEE